eukprot:1586752-Rhodomonas_salina.1
MALKLSPQELIKRVELVCGVLLLATSAWDLVLDALSLIPGKGKDSERQGPLDRQTEGLTGTAADRHGDGALEDMQSLSAAREVVDGLGARSPAGFGAVASRQPRQEPHPVTAAEDHDLGSCHGAAANHHHQVPGPAAAARDDLHQDDGDGEPELDRRRRDD